MHGRVGGLEPQSRVELAEEGGRDGWRQRRMEGMDGTEEGGRDGWRELDLGEDVGRETGGIKCGENGERKEHRKKTGIGGRMHL